MVKFQRVSIKEYTEKTEYWLKKYSEYMDKLAAINIAENNDIEELCGKPYLNYWSEFEEKYPEKVEERKKQRKILKEEYGGYSSYYNCPYYCIARNEKELDELYTVCYKDSNRGEGSLYQHNLKSLKEMMGKMYQDDCNKDVYGKFIGMAFFIDQDYYCLKDKKGEISLVLNVSEYKPEDHRSYVIVENGRDYL